MNLQMQNDADSRTRPHVNVSIEEGFSRPIIQYSCWERYSLKESGESRLGSKARPITALQSSLDNWFARKVDSLKTIMRVIFGIVWAIDGAFKLQPGFADTFQSFISSAPSNQPAWLQGWFSFWASITSSNTTLFFYSVATIELGLAFCLIFGFLRKLAYTIGILFSLLLWSVPEGFGGPYGPSSTDIGTNNLRLRLHLPINYQRDKGPEQILTRLFDREEMAKLEENRRDTKQSVKLSQLNFLAYVQFNHQSIIRASSLNAKSRLLKSSGSVSIQVGLFPSALPSSAGVGGFQFA